MPMAGDGSLLLCSALGPGEHAASFLSMFSKLPTVLTFLHSMLNFKMTQPWVPMVIPQECEPIQPYCQRLATIMIMHNSEQHESPRGIAHLKKWQVERVRVFKSSETSRHEYISATVIDHTRTSTHHVAIERGRSSDRIPTDSIDSDPQQKGSATSISSASSSISPVHFAEDIISPLSNKGVHDKNDKLVFDLDFQCSELYLYQLAILALTLHEMHNSYLLTTSNCYHFAGSIVKVLELEYDIWNTVEGSEAGRWCGLDIACTLAAESIKGNKRGWNIDILREKYKINIKAFVRLFLYLIINIYLLLILGYIY